MSKYIAEVRYKFGAATITKKFRVRAKGPQYVKEQYHRYTHENYGQVSREKEDLHVHPLGRDGLVSELVNVKPVNEHDLRGLDPIQKV